VRGRGRGHQVADAGGVVRDPARSPGRSLMEHSHDTPTGSSTVDLLALVLRLALLLTTAFLAGGGLLRPLVGELPRRTKLTLSVLGGLSALLAVVSEFAVDITV